MSDTTKQIPSQANWQAVALVSPALSALATTTVLTAVHLDYFDWDRFSGVLKFMMWTIVFAPLIVVAYSVLIGGASVGVATAARTIFDRRFPGAGYLVRASVLAAATFCAVTAVAGVVATRTSAALDLELSTLTVAAICGAIAAVTAHCYAQRVFEHHDGNRR